MGAGSLCVVNETISRQTESLTRAHGHTQPHTANTPRYIIIMRFVSNHLLVLQHVRLRVRALIPPSPHLNVGMAAVRCRPVSIRGRSGKLVFVTHIHTGRAGKTGASATVVEGGRQARRDSNRRPPALSPVFFSTNGTPSPAAASRAGTFNVDLN